MARRRHTAEQIIHKLREAVIPLAMEQFSEVSAYRSRGLAIARC